MPVPRHAVVLTAGLGTRLRPLTLVRAKGALPVAGESLICRIGRWLVTAGVTDLVLNLHHLPATIAAVVGDGSGFGARVRYSWEQPRVLGSAGGPRTAMEIMDAQRFLIVNGDTLTNVDLHAMAAAHAASGAAVTLALVPNLEPMKYGGVWLDQQSRVTGFVPAGAAAGSYHFVGIQVAEARAFETVPPGQPAATIGGLYDRLISAIPGAVRGFVSDATFQDIGTTQDYWNTSLALSRAEGRALNAGGARVRIDPSAHADRAVVWDDVEVGAGAVLDECIVTDGVSVPAHAVHRRAILLKADSGYAVHALPPSST